MLSKRLIITASALLLGGTQALKINSAIVTIEASHGGAGEGLTNLTVTIPLTTTYSNATALAEVSTLYLIGANGVPANSITCSPFKNTDGTGDAGLFFDNTDPSYISTNTVTIGSIVCISSDISFSPSGVPGGPVPLSSSSSSGLQVASSSVVASSSSTVPPQTSTHTRTHGKTRTAQHASAQTSAGMSSSATNGAAAGAQTSKPTTSSSAAPSAAQASGNGGTSLSLLSPGFFGGLALGGFGVAFAL